MKNYVLNMWRDYRAVMGSYGRWCKNYWFGYLMFIVLTYCASAGMTNLYLKRLGLK